MKYIAVVIVTLLLISCSTGVNKESVLERDIDYSCLDTVKLDNWYGKVPEKNMYLSELIDSLVLIPLETNNTCLITKIQKIRFVEDYIFIFDSRQEIIFIFSKEGKYLRKIDSKGKGPKEYIQMNDFTITDNNEIVIISFGRKLIAYDFNGKYLWHKKIEIMAATEIEYAGKDIFYISCLYRGEHSIDGDMQFNLLKFHKNQGILAKYLPYDNKIGKQHQFSKSEYFGTGLNGDLFLTKFYDENVYRLSRESVYAVKNINIEGMNIDKEKVFNIVDLSVEFKKKKIFAYLCNYHSTMGYDYLSYRISNSKINVYINNKNNIRFFTSNSKWKKEPNFISYLLGYHSPYCSVDEYFVTSFFPGDWFETKGVMTKYFHELGTKKEEMFPNKWIDRKLAHLNKNDNPVIVLYKFKLLL